MGNRLGSVAAFVAFTAVALAAVALPPSWQDPHDAVQEAPGFNPERVYTEILPTDHVDIATGALMLTQPLWTAPQAGDLSLSLDLYHSSVAGDRRRWGGNPQAGSAQDGFYAIPPNDVNRLRDSWVAPTFELSLGRIALVAAFEDTYVWHWLDETGAQHRLWSVDGAAEPVPITIELPGGGSTPLPLSVGSGAPPPVHPAGRPGPFKWPPAEDDIVAEKPEPCEREHAC